MKRPNQIHRVRLVLGILGTMLLANAYAANRAGGSEHSRGGYTIYVVPHSHMDLEWMWTYQQGQAFAVRILGQALHMLKEDPGFAFTQDQLAALKPFWDSLSEDDRQFLRGMIHEGRFEVATGMVVQPDVNEPDFESLTRQLLMANPWLEMTLGAKVQTAWNVDTFGQTVQMPQLFRRAGLRYAFFSRDVPPSEKATIRNLFYWRSPDGSRVLAHIAPYATGLEKGSMAWWTEASGAKPEPLALQTIKDLMAHNPVGNDQIMLPWGGDEYLPTETSLQIEAKVRQAAAKLHVPVRKVVITTASGYFQAVENSGVSLPTYTEDFNPPLVWDDLRGIWGERPKQKLAERRAEDMLESSEKLASIAGVYGEPYAERDFKWAWQRLLANQVHDTMAGSISDPVYQVSMSRYAGAIEAGRQIEADALYRLSRQIDTSGSGDFPILVFNALSFPRTEVAHFSRTFTQAMNMTNRRVSDFRLLDPEGHAVPFSIVAASRISALADDLPDEAARRKMREAGVVTMAEIEFVATDVPATGYRVYRIESVEGHLETSPWHPVAGEISNHYFTLRIDPATGSIVQLIDRRAGTDLLAPSRYGANELVLEEEKDPDMEGTLHITGSEIRASEFKPVSITQQTDDIGRTVRIEAPFMGGRRIQEIRLYQAVPRIDFKTELKGFPGHDGLLTVVFPLRRGGNATTKYETHNAVVERPDGVYAAHTWAEVGDARYAVALINHGTGGYQVNGKDIRLILLRSVTHYGLYQAPEGSEVGDHAFEYSLYPHAGSWQQADVIEQAHSVNSPLRVISTDAHEGSLPLERSFLSIDEGHFEVTALKKAERGEEFILRGHETLGKAARVRLRLGLPLQQAWHADLLEQPGQAITIQNGHVEFDCQPFEFVSLRLRMSK